jgi:hypothetical protein
VTTMVALHTRAPTTEITDRLTAMGHPTGAWSWEACTIETVMQIATTMDVMQAAGAMQQCEGQEDFAAHPGPRHRTLRMQIIVSD